MTKKDFIPTSFSKELSVGKVTWVAPSNIALIKYWGKKPDQIPANPSLSFTLDTCATTTTIDFKKLDKQGMAYSFDLFFEGKSRDDFRAKIQTFFERVDPYVPFLKDYHLVINTSNSFPHSSGIASSASGMAALALCIMEIERKLDPEISESYFTKKASFLARLGSGSACRSIEGSIIQWGTHPDVKGSSDLFGIRYPGTVHQVFNNYQDTILLVHKGQKGVSSTVGHKLMYGHHFAAQRFKQAGDNLVKLQGILENGDLDGFNQIVESEALTLHAMMMTSVPYFVLMKPNTLNIIERIWAYRKRSARHVCFTLDAGANVHVLYPENEKQEVYEFIQDELLAYCENGEHICDNAGGGAKMK